jgi:ornithine carbamoyltransferase
LMTLQERFGSLKSLNFTYIGDGNNILHSLLMMAPLMGMNVRYACPKGYGPQQEIVERAQVRALLGGGSIESYTTPLAACKGTHAIYTDVFTSMGFEHEQKEREKAFKGYCLNNKLFSVADADCAIMHCLPMHRDEEISSEMVEHKNSVLFQQSENRLHVQKAMLLALMS